MVRVLITMTVAALFYAIPRESYIGDYFLLGYETGFGWIPVFIIGSCVEWSRPKDVELGAKIKKEYSLVIRQHSISKQTSISTKQISSKQVSLEERAYSHKQSSTQISNYQSEPERAHLSGHLHIHLYQHLNKHLSLR